MAAATPCGIWEFHEKVVRVRTVTIDFCLGLERGDMKYIRVLMKDITRFSYYLDDVIGNEQDGFGSDWPPAVDRDDLLRRLIDDRSPDPGDADIRHWLDMASGTVDKPLGKSLHSQVIKQFRSLYAETHDPELPNLWAWDDLAEADQKAKDRAILRDLAEIARKHREELENITPEMLEAEAHASIPPVGAPARAAEDSNIEIIEGKIGDSAVIKWKGTRYPVSDETVVAFRLMEAAKGQPIGIGKHVSKASRWFKDLQKSHPALAALVKRDGNKGYRLTIYDRPSD